MSDWTPMWWSSGALIVSTLDIPGPPKGWVGWAWLRAYKRRVDFEWRWEPFSRYVGPTSRAGWREAAFVRRYRVWEQRAARSRVELAAAAGL